MRRWPGITLCMLAPLRAFANEPPVVCETTPSCLESFTGAQHLAKEGQLREALVVFQSLYAKFADPRLCFPIGRMYQKQGQYEQAATYYRRFIASGVETNAENLARVEKLLAEAQAAAARIEPPAKSRPVERPVAPTDESPASAGARLPGAVTESPVLAPGARATAGSEGSGRQRAHLLLGLGIPLSAVGATMLGLGIGALAVNGTCAQTITRAGGPECDQRYDSGAIGTGVTVGGAVLLLSGIGVTVAGGLAYRQSPRRTLTSVPSISSPPWVGAGSHD